MSELYRTMGVRVVMLTAYVDDNDQAHVSKYSISYLSKLTCFNPSNQGLKPLIRSETSQKIIQAGGKAAFSRNGPIMLSPCVKVCIPHPMYVPH